MSERPTWDATYQGLPLSISAYAAHLVILRAYRARKVPVFPDGTGDLTAHEATVAVHASGISRCAGCAVGGSAFHWCQYRLSAYGEVYAAQRGC